MTKLNKNPAQDDYNLFLQNEDTHTIDSQDKTNLNLSGLEKIVSRELVSSKLKLASTFIILSLIGYALNLSICAQGPVGLTKLSHEVFHLLHISVHSCICAFVCGFTLTSMPFALAFVFLNPFQRRYLLFRMAWILVIIPLLATSIIFIWTLHPLTSSEVLPVLGVFELKMEIVNGFIWTVSALMMPALLQWILSKRHRQPVFK